jgi:hypothetical protein
MVTHTISQLVRSVGSNQVIFQSNQNTTTLNINSILANDGIIGWEKLAAIHRAINKRLYQK